MPDEPAPVAKSVDAKDGKTSEKACPLKFGENDLVYGPSANGKLRELQEQAGGKLLSDLPKPPGTTFEAFTKSTLNEAAQTGKQVHFDLTHVEEVENVLKGEGKFANKITSVELRHIRDNWENFAVKPKFYSGGSEIGPPWL